MNVTLYFHLKIGNGIIIILFLTACDLKFPDEQLETEKQYHEVLDVDGNIKSRISAKEGKLNDEIVTFNWGGQISAVVNYVDNKKTGIEKKYYQQGPLYRTLPYKNGYLHGIETRYYKS